jgi:hypothetical protein
LKFSIVSEKRKISIYSINFERRIFLNILGVATTVLPTHGAATVNTTRLLTRRVLANLSMILAEEILELEADTSL